MKLNELFNGSYQKKRVFVTGHTGFKGAWLCLWLRELGADVAGYSLDPPSSPSFFEQCGLSGKIQSYRGDIRDSNKLLASIDEFKPEIIFHLAAQPIIRRAYEIPEETISVNVMGTVHLLEAVRKTSSVRVCQVITSDKCYENREEQNAFSEEDRLGGYDPYSASKGCVELVTASFRNSFFPPDCIHEHGVSLSTARAGNAIAGGDWGRDRIIPDVVRSIGERSSVVVRNPFTVRPWQYALDLLAGYLLLAEKQMTRDPIYAGAWNFGPSITTEPITVKSLVEHFLNFWQNKTHPAAVIYENDTELNSLHEAKFLRLNCEKANHILGWRSIYPIETTLQETAWWYQSFLSNPAFPAYEFSKIQIMDYADAASRSGCVWAREPVRTS